MSDKTEAQELFEQASAANMQTANIATGAFISLPEGYDVHDLEEFQAEPNRIKTDYKFRDTKSLAAYLERFQKPETVAFSNSDTREIYVVIDHHDTNGDEQVASHGDHRATFCAQFSAQYEAWRKIDGNMMSQSSAGMFLEERATDVIEPDAASIMDMVMTFDALKKVTFRQSTRLHDGQRQFTYNEENEVRGNVTLPERIIMLVPIFQGQEPEHIEIRILYRIEDGSLRFKFNIHDLQMVEDTAFVRCEDALAAEVKDELLILRTV